jgi:hypothetical protein
MGGARVVRSEMTTLVQAASHVRKSARASFGYVIAGSVGLLDLLGVFRERQSFGVEHVLIVGAWLCVFGARVRARTRGRAERSDGFIDLEQGLLLLAATHALLQLLGGLLSPLYPVLYVLVAFIGAFAERGQSRLIVLAAVAFEAPLYFFTEGNSDPKPYALHAIFLTLFGLINVVFTQAELTRVRLMTYRERAEEKRRVKQEARLFRLSAPPTDGRRDDDHLWRSSIDEVRSALYWNLLLLKRTLELKSAVLLLCDRDAGMLRVIELASDCRRVRS